MENTSNTHENGNNANTVLYAGRLNKGDHFQTRKNGKWYTVHAQCVEQMNDGSSVLGRGEFYTVAVCRKKMYAFDYMQVVYSPCI